MTLNFQRKSPVTASYPRICPGTFSCRVCRYPCSWLLPTTTTPLVTIGGDELVMYPTSAGSPSVG